MACKMASAVQAHLIDKGRCLDAVQFMAGTELERCELVVDLPAGADLVGKPARRVTHVAFMAVDVEGAPAIGCAPALGVVALADAPRLREAVFDAIVLEGDRYSESASPSSFKRNLAPKRDMAGQNKSLAHRLRFVARRKTCARSASGELCLPKRKRRTTHSGESA
jgi:hypothetical protein